MARKFDYKFMVYARDGSITVKGVVQNGYPSYSVLAGQDMICFVGSYPTVEEAKAAHPELDENSFRSQWTAPRNTVSHLSDEGDY
jgi:hypothetical protein